MSDWVWRREDWHVHNGEIRKHSGGKRYGSWDTEGLKMVLDSWTNKIVAGDDFTFGPVIVFTSSQSEIDTQECFISAFYQEER